MATEAEILALLTGRKVFDGRQWRVYDSGGVEIADPGGVLWKGVHGALLWNAALSQLNRDAGDGGGPARRSRKRGYYLRRKGEVLFFDSVEDAQAYVDAERAAERAIRQAQKTSRRARKRLRERVLGDLAPTPAATIESTLLERLEALQALPALPSVEGYLDAVSMIRAVEAARRMREEDDEVITYLLMHA